MADQYDLVDALIIRAKELGWEPMSAETVPGVVILTFQDGRDATNDPAQDQLPVTGP